MAAELIELRGARKTYVVGAETIHALRGVDLTISKGELVAIVGPSGSGKSTLMNVIGCLDSLTEGSYQLEGLEVSGLSDDRLAELRNRSIGFVFQTFNLLARQSALENVALPLRYSGLPRRERERRSRESLERVELSDRVTHRPDQLSGGQKQRVAIARSLVTHPSILLADEPTGALDQRTGREILKLFHRLNGEGVTVILVTHDRDVASSAARQVTIVDGAIVSDDRRTPG
ncbi:MAG: ABC transporter ATP-binding protein [Deltaproteobacteria bacterium]|nr:ABC transporter ATP-binding protein [Deltaproteobacteria bacterium]